MENECLRAACNMLAHGYSGILIKEVAPLSTLHGKLHRGDVVIAVDGRSVGNDGTVSFREMELVQFEYLVSRKRRSERTQLTLVRDGVVVEIEATLGPVPPVSPRYHGFRNCQPVYFIVGGLVFVPLSWPLLVQSVNSMRSYIGANMVTLGYDSFRKDSATEVIVLLRILLHDVNYGYQDLDAMEQATQLLEFNGTKIQNMKQLVRLATQTSDQFMSFDLDGGDRIVLSTEEAKMAEREILDIHGIPQPMSPDLLESLAVGDP
jgi:hypothetical protein